MSCSESVVEDAAIEWLQGLGYAYLPGPDIAPGGYAPERASYATSILEGRLRSALQRLNPHLEADTLDEVLKQVKRIDGPSLDENNLAFHRMLTKGVEVQVRRDGAVRGDIAWLVDFDDPDTNDWLVVNQFTVIEKGASSEPDNRRPDMVVFLNGLPVAVVELKNPEAENATLKSAWNQIQTYKAQIPGLFTANEIVVISDGVKARVGSLTAGLEWFGRWRTVDGFELAPSGAPELEIVIHGLFEKGRLLDYLRHFVLWETEDGYVKKLAGYHQFHAVRKAVTATVKASGAEGDRRIGVVWHTQGSGKSISMAFFAGRIIAESAMENPTLVVLTDRNDLDDQLFGQFCRASDLVPSPVQADSRKHLRELLNVASGGVVFTTMQKFGTAPGERMPELSGRRNIVVIADEAHRSQYAFVDGFARNLRDALPNASFIGFTGTPIEFEDKSTPAVFGDYVDTYTIGQSVEDERTVPILYEARLAKISLPEENKPVLDEEFEEVTEGEEDAEKLKARWARLEEMVGTEERLAVIAQDIVDHWERRKEILAGKAMIVGMSRRICVDLYDQIVKLRPDWHGEGDEEGAIKVVMTTSASDPEAFIPHNRTKPRQKVIEKRFKDAADPLELVIVRDMWLTGFDVPSAHTLYVDKPMKGHGLMQAIARVNRVFKDKPAGLVVDYLGLAEQLRKAVKSYGGRRRDQPGVPVEEALDVLREKYEIVEDMFHGFDYSGYFGSDSTARVGALSGGANHICGRAVAPLDDRERDRLVAIFKSWRHPRVREARDRAAILADGSTEGATRVIERLEAFLAFEAGFGNDQLYELSLNALHRLLVEQKLRDVERESATRELLLQVEPFVFKLLAIVAPDEEEKMRGKKRGLVAGLIALRRLGANPDSESIAPGDFEERRGGETWTTLQHAACDVVGSRLDVAHRSTGLEAHTWRSTLCYLLAMLAHNAEALAHLPDPAPGLVDGKRRFQDAMTKLNKAAGIAIHLEEARDMRDGLGYFQAVHAQLRKYSTSGGDGGQEGVDFAIRQVISDAVVSDEVVDIFGAAGIEKPDLSILSDEFLATVKESPYKNLQIELLKKLMSDEVTSLKRQNVVQARRFSEMLEQTLLRYQNRTLESAEVILELIEMAKEMRDAPKRGDALGLSEDELAFYDALADHGDVNAVMGKKVLAEIAHELVEAIRGSVAIDWTQKESVRAKMRSRIKRLLRKFGYPPDKQAAAVFTVIEQAEQVCREWVSSEAG